MQPQLPQRFSSISEHALGLQSDRVSFQKQHVALAQSYFDGQLQARLFAPTQLLIGRVVVVEVVVVVVVVDVVVVVVVVVVQSLIFIIPRLLSKKTIPTKIRSGTAMTTASFQSLTIN